MQVETSHDKAIENKSQEERRDRGGEEERRLDVDLEQTVDRRLVGETLFDRFGAAVSSRAATSRCSQR